MSTAPSTAEQIILLPKKFRESEKSFFTLLNETGYSDVRGEISVMDIRKAISKYPECISEWLGYSEDKRVGSGWFFQKRNDRFAVGFLRPSGEVNPLNVYDNDFDACAKFIKEEMEGILRL